MLGVVLGQRVDLPVEAGFFVAHRRSRQRRDATRPRRRLRHGYRVLLVLGLELAAEL